MPHRGNVCLVAASIAVTLSKEKPMIRLIKRYESRKLYDTEESRYVSLDEISTWIRQGQEVRVVDNATNNDVTSQTLTQIILEEGRKGTSFLPSELLHDLVRIGERAVSNGMEQMQNGVDRLIDRLGPVRKAREEMSSLRARLEQLETSLSELERDDLEPAAVESKNGRPAERQAVTVGKEGESQ
jgi:polyhydroxyalkanoate synthesis repressor PhaR